MSFAARARLWSDVTHLPVTPLQPISRDPLADMMHRHALLSQSDDFYRGAFGGRTPTFEERLAFVEQAIQRMNSQQIWENDVYHVEVVLHPPFIHLDIRRKDGQPGRSWRDFQQIKNQLVGPAHEAVELFPAEDRLVDTAHQYHLWVHGDPSYRFGFGFPNRCVLREPIRVEMNRGFHASVPATMDSFAALASAQ